MQFEEFDNKVRQAADHHHPTYDEQAWSKMEKLLDKHLPNEEEKKRRFIFFLLFFLLLGGSAWLLISKPWEKGKDKLTDSGMVTTKTKEERKTNPDRDTNKEDISGKIEINNASTTASKPEIDSKANKPQDASQNLLLKTNNRDIFFTPRKEKKPNKTMSVAIKDIKSNADDQVSSISTQNNKQPDISKSKNAPVSAQVQDPLKNALVEEKKNLSATEVPQKDANKMEQQETIPENKKVAAQQIEKKTKAKTKKPNSFFFAFSAGPDLSFVGSDKPGTVKLVAGGGIGFTLHDRFTIRTGFYSGRKVYTASPGSYNPPAAWWAYYPNLEKVDADCKVYEIPLLLSYNFGGKRNRGWFASAGVSSLLMKKEVYNYFYKYTASGPTITKKWTIEDQNKHYFSILTLSGGYQQKVGKHISLMVEPYIKLPLTGVGFGKVKLNSSGILFTVGINPFNKQKSVTKNLR